MSNSNKIIKIKTQQSYEIKILFEVLKEIITEANITFTKKQEVHSDDDENEKKEKQYPAGMRIVALDDHQTLMIYVKLSAEKFVEYHVKYPKFNVGLDLRELHKFMKGVDKDCVMTISVDKDDEQRIDFTLQNPAKGIDCVYKQKLMDIEDSTQKIPQHTSFEISVIMNTNDFRKICSEMSQFSEFMEIICTSKEITFKCVGDQSEYVKTFKSCDGDEGVEILCVADKNKRPPIVQAIYNLKHLITFGKCTSLCKKMQLYLKNTYPLFINYTIGDLGQMLVGLAPFDEKTIKQGTDYNNVVNERKHRENEQTENEAPIKKDEEENYAEEEELPKKKEELTKKKEEVPKKKEELPKKKEEVPKKKEELPKKKEEVPKKKAPEPKRGGKKKALLDDNESDNDELDDEPPQKKATELKKKKK
jgi:proliferating cell nuclear antigen PCNA